MPPTPPNPIWGLLWKINQIAVPLLLAWGIWVTSSIYDLTAWKSEGGRFTSTHGLQLEITLRKELQTMADLSSQMDLKIMERINMLPPQDWKDRITRMERTLEENQKALARIEAKLETK